VLKAYARQIWRCNYHSGKGEKVKRSDIASTLVEAWGSIAPNVIEAGWECYLLDTDFTEDESDDEESSMDDGEYRPLISIHDLEDG
jgi:hypothetical protein